MTDVLRNMISRRAFLGQTGYGVGAAALGSMLARDEGHPLSPSKPRPKARRVIHLCMAGGPSHLEGFDWKPELRRMHGQDMPESFTKGQPIAQLQGQKLRCLGPQYDFSRHGQSGQQISDAFPKMARLADDICIVRSMFTEQINHDPAHTFMNTGTAISGRPSMGSWVLYGLGAETEDLPGFVVLSSVGKGGQAQPISARQWHSGFLPGRYQGVRFHSIGDPVHYVGRPPGVDDASQRQVLDAIRDLDLLQQGAGANPEIATRIAQYEMGYRMHTSVPELTDLSDEPQEVLDLYGTRGGDGTFASNCLLARRLAERGVRFIQLYHRAWDHHGNIRGGFAISAKEVDQATYALVTDLKRRGLLEDTLIIYGGEFGRTPMGQGSGRDHHIKGFSLWLAGAGIRGGFSYGATDELGYHAVQDRVHVNDLHATMLHLLGVNHERLTYRYRGRDFRLTDVAGQVVRPILA
ncbi:MAG: sulfatase [Planctomycetes bacterium]|nr:sulfatase [Planctomycetota bacterium]